MSSIDTTPTYNLKVVVHETGVKPDTLRAWERRYGLPNPERSSGRHRLYSQYDIELIKWLVDRQEEGLSISNSVELWHNLVEAGREPLAEYGNSDQPVAAALPQAGATVEALRDGWIEACLRFDEAGAEQVLTQAFALYPPVMVCVEVLQKGLARIGTMWYRNDISVQQEHFASALAMRRLNALVAAAPAPSRPERLIVACPENEDHVFPPLLLTLMLRYHGWEVIYLGANVPLARLETTIEAVHPSLVIMTAQQMHTAANLLLVGEVLHHAGVPLAFGGRIFVEIPDLAQRVPGHYLGNQLEQTAQNVAQILERPQDAGAINLIPDRYRRAADQFRLRRAAIESEVWQLLQASAASYDHVANANMHLSRDILSALHLGDMNLLGAEIDWTEKLLLNYDMPPQVLHDYLLAYHQAAEKYLAGDGAPITEWLANIASRGHTLRRTS